MQKFSENRKKGKKDIKRITFCFIITLIAISICICVLHYLNGVLLTQFSPMTESQMMGYAIKTKNNKIIMIDGGTVGDTPQIVQYIKENGGEVDAWFLTHPHEDHVGAIQEILKNEKSIHVKKIYNSFYDLDYIEKNVNRYEYNEAKDYFDAISTSESSNIINEVNVNDEIFIDNVKIKILAVKNEELKQNFGNNSSLIIKFYINKKSLLILGDSGIEKGKWLIENQKKYLKSDFVQVSHHGQNGVDKQVYEYIMPKVRIMAYT